MARVLLVGAVDSKNWTVNLIKKVKAADCSIHIDAFSDKVTPETSLIKGFCNCVHSVKKHYASFLYKIPKLRAYLNARDRKKSLLEFVDECKQQNIYYDIINYHFIRQEILSCSKELKSISHYLILTPWGSDVLRKSSSEISQMISYVNDFDYVTDAGSSQFREKLHKLLQIPESKFINIDFGADLIDLIKSNCHISTEEAKKRIGFVDRYIITCGYNGHKEQHHLEIIEAISKCRSSLPDNLILLLPMAYGVNVKYKSKVEEKLKNCGLEYHISTEYLTGERLFYLRKCSDMFIHAQPTDANSSTLAEYLMCGTIIINASWLNYDIASPTEEPFYAFDSFMNLPQAIIDAYQGGSRVNEIVKRKMDHYGWSYRTNQWVHLYNGEFSKI